MKTSHIFWNITLKIISDRQKRVTFRKLQKLLNHSTLVHMLNNLGECFLSLKTTDMAQGELIATYLCQKKNYIVAKYQTSLQKTLYYIFRF